MAKSSSGRIVIVLDPAFKKQLYLALTIKDMTMKRWVLSEADTLIKETQADQFNGGHH